MARVFVLEEVNKNIDKAKSFGELVYLFPANESRPSIFETESFIGAITMRLAEMDFDPTVDFFLAAGSSVSVNLAFFVLTRDYNKFEVLFFHAAVQEYIPRVLENRKICHERAV